MVTVTGMVRMSMVRTAMVRMGMGMEEDQVDQADRPGMAGLEGGGRGISGGN